MSDPERSGDAASSETRDDTDYSPLVRETDPASGVIPSSQGDAQERDPGAAPATEAGPGTNAAGEAWDTGTVDAPSATDPSQNDSEPPGENPETDASTDTKRVSGVIPVPDTPSQQAERRVDPLLDELAETESPAMRADLLRQLGELYEEALGEPAHARLSYTQALCEQPQDATSTAALERLCQGAEDWLEALMTLQEALPGTAERSPEDEAALCALLGRWYRDELGRADLSLAYVERATALAPSDRDAWTQLVEARRNTLSHRELSENLLHLASLQEGVAEAAELRFEAAHLLFRTLDEPERALPLYRQVLQEQPQHRKAAEELGRLLRQQGAWSELVERLEAQLAHAEDPRATAALHHELGRLQETQQDDDAAAIQHYRKASEGDFCPEALRDVVRLERKAGNFQAVLQGLKAWIQSVDSPATRREALWEMAEVQREQLADYAGAAASLEQVVELDGGDDPAYGALCELYRRQLDSAALVHTLERRARATEDPQLKQSALLEAARTALADLGDRPLSLSLCERVLGAEPNHVPALNLIARLRAMTGDRIGAIEALSALAEAESDPEHQAARWFEAARLRATEGDTQGACELYENALEAQPQMPAAVQALGQLYRESGDPRALLEWLERRARQENDAARQSALLTEIGRVREEQRGESREAATAYRRALALSPDNVQAGLALGEMAMADGDMAGAIRYLTPVLASPGGLTVEATLRACLTCGRAQQHLQHFEEAEASYRRARNLAPEELAPKLALALLGAVRGQHAEAIAELQGCLAEREGLSEDELISVLVSLSEAHTGLDATDAAGKSLEAALKEWPTNPLLLAAMVQVKRAAGDPEGVLQALRQRWQAADSDEVRAETMLEIADVMADSLDDPDAAIRTLQDALALDVDARKALTRLMSLYSLGSRWMELVSTLERLAQLSDEAPVRAKYLATAASVSEKHLDDVDGAARHLAQVLELTPDDERSFLRYLDCLEALGEQDTLAGVLRERLERGQGEQDRTRFAPWADRLAEALVQTGAPLEDHVLWRKRALDWAPDLTRRRDWMEAMLQAPDAYDEALVESVRQLQREAPREALAFRAIHRVYEALGQTDAMWCAAQALKCIDAADEEQLELFRKHRKVQAADVRQPMADALRRATVVHPEQSRLITELFASVMPAVLHTHSLAPAQHRLDAHREVEPQSDSRLIVQMLRYAAGVLELPLPPIYYNPRDQGGVTLLAAEGLTVAFGAAALADVPDQAVAFVAGQKLSFLLPGHALRLLETSGSGLRAWLLAAVRTAEPSFPVPGDLRSRVARYQGVIDGALRAEERDLLDRRVHALLEQAPELDMKRWARAVDYTSDRIGFILADSLPASIAVVEAGAGSDPAELQQRIDQLYAYSVSPEYLALRQQLGIAIE